MMYKSESTRIISPKFLLIFFLAAAVALPGIYAQEKQVPFFPEQEVVTIDKGYARKMSLFREYEKFVEAKLFLTEDQQYAVEIFYEEGDTLFKERKLLTATEKDEYLESLVLEYARANQPEVAANPPGNREMTLLNQKGRTPMLVMNTITGLGFYGPALPLSLGIEDEKAVIGMYMIAAGASFYLPYQLSKNKNVTLGQASLTFYGQSRGAMHGLFLAELLTKDPYYEYYNDWDRYDDARDRRERFFFATGMATSIAGGIAGNRLAARWDYNGGSTSILQMWGDVGTISGLLFSEVFNFWDRREPDAVFATTMLTSAAGLTAGKIFGDMRNFTLGDAIVYRSAIALSAFIPAAVVHLADPEEFKPYAVAGLAGIAFGSYAGYRATANRDFETSEGVFIALGELAGGLLGLGLGYLIAPDTDAADQVFLTTSAIGAASGYFLMYSQFSNKALTVSNKISLDMSINPMGLLMNREKIIRPDLAPMFSLASMRMRF